MKIIIAILILMLIIFIIPWYVKQLGRFFSYGMVEFMNEYFLIEKKGETNGKKTQR